MFIFYIYIFKLRIKTWLKLNISEERLVGLALFYTYRYRSVQVDKLIVLFADTKIRN